MNPTNNNFTLGLFTGIGLSLGLFYISKLTSSKSTKTKPPCHITDQDVQNLLTMKEAIQINKEAFASLYQGTANVPPRNIVSIQQHNGATLFKPCYIKSSSALGLKVVSTRPNNSEQNLPTVPATITMFDEKTGLLDAILEATYLTALRTAAGSGAASDILAVPNAKTLIIFGSGMQAKAHLDAMMVVRGTTIRTVHIVNRNQTRGEKLVTYASDTYDTIQVFWHALDNISAETIKTADIICTTTNTSIPLFDGNLMSENTHVNAIGSYTRTMQEIDSACVSRCIIYIDTVHALDSGDICIPFQKGLISKLKNGLVEIGYLLSQEKEGVANLRNMKSISNKTCTLFKSVGTAVQDIATAAAVVKKVKELNTL